MNIPLTPLRFLHYARTQFPHKVGVVCDGNRLTYAEFGDRVGRLAGALRGMGLQDGDRVAFLSTNCHRLLEAYYGVVEVGGVLLPLNVRLSPKELGYIMNHSGAKFLFVENMLLELASAFREEASTVQSFHAYEGKPEQSWLAKETYEDLLASASVRWRDITEFDENSIAELFYTSGSTADPKGVMLSHRTLYLHALYGGLALSTSGSSIELHTIPLFHANGWGVAHSLTFVGGTHVMIHKFDPVEVFRLVEQEKAQAMALVPTMATALVHCTERSKFDLSSLERITIGGAASSPALVRAVEEAFGCPCYAGYGLTETSPVLTLAQIKHGLECEGEERIARQAMTGFAIPGVELCVVDEQGNDVPRDGQTVGEIIARGDNVMEGYWQDPAGTEAAIRDGWFHTGDMATIDENEYLLIVDRKKEMILSGGENVSSLEVEKVLLEHPAVYEVAVIAVPDKKWGEVPKALVVLKLDAEAKTEELIEFVRSRLAGYKVPKSVEFRGSLPKGGTGKILKKDLRKKYWPESDKVGRGAAQ